MMMDERVISYDILSLVPWFYQQKCIWHGLSRTNMRIIWYLFVFVEEIGLDLDPRDRSMPPPAFTVGTMITKILMTIVPNFLWIQWIFADSLIISGCTKVQQRSQESRLCSHICAHHISLSLLCFVNISISLSLLCFERHWLPEGLRE
jgi:hypothetical protein